MKEMGFGMCELKPDEFWDLTPMELVQLSRGAMSRYYDRRAERGELIAYTLSQHSKRTMNIRKFVGRPIKRGGGADVLDRDEQHRRDAAVRKLNERLEAMEKSNGS